MESFHLIIRRCSAYSFPDIIIGIFDDSNLAAKAKQHYIEQTEQNDMYAVQAYHTVNLETDVEIIPINVDISLNYDYIYFLVKMADFMGQTDNKPIYFSTTFSKLKDKYLIKDSKIKSKEIGWPTWFEWDFVKLNEIRHVNCGTPFSDSELDSDSNSDSKHDADEKSKTEPIKKSELN